MPHDCILDGVWNWTGGSVTGVGPFCMDRSRRKGGVSDAANKSTLFGITPLFNNQYIIV